MPNYPRSAYGSNPLAGASRNNASKRGWGRGWPNCQTGKTVAVTYEDHKVVVRREVAQMVAVLFEITDRLGYDVNPRGQVNQTWGFACRAIRGTKTASNHSWALAIDMNSLANPMQSSFKSNIPPNVVRAWESCRWYWGGRYGNRPDAMHFEYVGTPAQVAGDLARARSILAGLKPQSPKPQKNPSDNLTEEEMATLDEILAEIKGLRKEEKDRYAVYNGQYQHLAALGQAAVGELSEGGDTDTDLEQIKADVDDLQARHP